MTQRFLDICDSLILNAPSAKQLQQQQQQQQQQQLLKSQQAHGHPQQPPPHHPLQPQFQEPRMAQRGNQHPVGNFRLDNPLPFRGVSGFGTTHRGVVSSYRQDGPTRMWSVTGVKAYNETPSRGQGQRVSTQGAPDSSLSPRNGSAKLVSQGGYNNHNRIQRQRSLKNSSDDAIKWSRPHQSSYQLSQDLHDKQVEMLERKYGGSIRSRRAARTIQRAFRHYCMNKNFQKLRHSYGERRLSKRLSELGRSNTIWSDRVATEVIGTAEDNGSTHAPTCAGEDNFGRNIRNMVAEFENAGRSSDPGKFQQMKSSAGSRVDKPRPIPSRPTYTHRSVSNRTVDHHSGMERSIGKENHPAHLSHNSFSSPDFYADGFYGRGGRSKSASVSSQGSDTSGRDVYYGGDTTSNRGQYEMNSSGGGGDFMRTPALENTAVDPHSMDFEALLESKETDILTDSFHSEGGCIQEVSGSIGNPDLIIRQQAPFLGSQGIDYTSSPCGSFDSFRTISIDPSDYLPGCVENPDIKINPASPDETISDPTKESSNAVQPMHCATNSGFRHPSRDFSPSGQLRNVAIVPPTRSSGSSPVWQRKGTDRPNDPQISNGSVPGKKGEPKRMSNISETSEVDSTEGVNSSSQSSENASSENMSVCSENSLTYQRKLRMSIVSEAHTIPRANDKMRKRLYRIGLNLFNKKPEKGLDFLLDNLFLEGTPKSVARFFITRKGLSKQMIGEFLGNLQNPFSQEVLQYFCEEIDLSGLQVDLALRKFQCHFRMPGEAQKIERLMEAFADRYCECNSDLVKTFRNPDTVFLLAFAVIMLNTDLHNPSVKAERKMKLEEFIKNMRGIDDGDDIDPELLTGIYDRVKSQEFKAGVDQVTQVMKVEQTIMGKKPILSLPHRRLVCYCRLYEVHDPNKKEKIGLHQREVFLFNDLLLITKIFSKKKAGITYSFRSSLSLSGMQVYLFETSHYQFGIQLTNNIDGKPLITFNARNDHDRQKFVEDLKESILETNGMEQIRIEEEMARHRTTHNTMDKRYACDDSRVLAYDLAKSENPHNRLSAPECNLKKVPYSNSLTDLSSDPVMKRGSSGASLDSGMASGSVGSASSETQHSSTFGQSPTAPPQPHSTPPLGQGSGKRQLSLKTSIILKPGLPDGTQV